MGLLSLGAGIAIGYVIGTKTGKDRLNTSFDHAIKSAEDTWNRPEVQDFVAKATDTTTQLRHDLAESAKKAAAAATDAMQKVDELAEEFAPAQTKTTYDGDVVAESDQSADAKGNG